MLHFPFVFSTSEPPQDLDRTPHKTFVTAGKGAGGPTSGTPLCTVVKDPIPIFFLKRGVDRNIVDQLQTLEAFTLESFWKFKGQTHIFTTRVQE